MRSALMITFYGSVSRVVMTCKRTEYLGRKEEEDRDCLFSFIESPKRFQMTVPRLQQGCDDLT